MSITSLIRAAIFILFCTTASVSKSQSFQQTGSRSFDFHKANATLMASNNVYKTSFTISDDATPKKKGKMTKSKRLRIAGGVLIGVGAAALGATIAGGIIYWRNNMVRNNYSGGYSTQSILRFSGIVLGGSLATNALLGAGIWMVADN